MGLSWRRWNVGLLSMWLLSGRGHRVLAVGGHMSSAGMFENVPFVV